MKLPYPAALLTTLLLLPGVGGTGAAQSAPPPAPTAQVTGFAQFPFGMPLAELRAKLDRSYPDRYRQYDRSFGRQAFWLPEGMTLNGEAVAARFTFLDGGLMSVDLDREVNARELAELRTYLARRFGTPGRETLDATERQFGRAPRESYAGGRVLLEVRPTYRESSDVTVSFVDPVRAGRVRQQMSGAIDLNRLQNLLEAGAWQKLPRGTLADADQFVNALMISDWYEMAALLSAGMSTRERAWAGSYFYAGLIGEVQGEERQLAVLKVSSAELMNPLSMFTLGRLEYMDAAYNDDLKAEEAAALGTQGYINMMTGYELSARLMQVTPQMTSLLANTHTAMMAGLANGSGSLSAEDQARVDAAWAALYNRFKTTYRVPAGF